MQPDVEALRSSVPRVLVVEDEPLIRFAIAEALREEGVTVIEAATGDEAWEHFQRDTDIDIIFTRSPDARNGQWCRPRGACQGIAARCDSYSYLRRL